MAGRLAVVAAGGTGGHLFPAQALAEALRRRGWSIVLATDERGAAFADKFPCEERLALAAATAKSGDIVGMIRAGLIVARGVIQARKAFKRLDPAIVIGFGGYPALPGLLAALGQKRPTIIHEQNAVLGRVNRYLAPKVSALACAFPTLERATPGIRLAAHVIGNPVRPEIRALANVPYEPPLGPDGPVRLLVTGGSQGARLISELTPQAVRALPERLRARLQVQQQTRPESMDSARRTYADCLVKAEIAPFFRDMAGCLGTAHLVLGRAGASTVSELAAAGRPSILVPLKIAADDHQRFNAKLLEDVGAAAVASEDELTVESLAGALRALLEDPGRLERMSASARSVAQLDGAEKLADLVEELARP